MKTSLKNFLTDLYEIDPSLKTHEAELIPLVEKLLKSDPAVEPDDAFVKRLRLQLKDRAAELSAPASSGFQKWFFALGGAVTAAVVIPVAFVAFNNMKPTLRMDDGTTLFSYSVKDEGKEAFGALSDFVDQNAMSRNQSGGGGMVSARPEMAPVVAGATATNEVMALDAPVPAMDAKMIAPFPMTKYEYVYSGTFPELASTVAVYKRNPSGKTLPLSAIGGSLNLGNVDLGSFAGMNVQTVSFSQDKPYGYQISVNLTDSSVSIDANWMQWPQSNCQTDACFQAQRVKLSDIPSNEDLITIADAFIKDHGIDITHYGRPEVDMQWKASYDRTPNKNDAWIPDSMRVVYPLVVDGHEITEQNGQAFGISVGIHVKSRKVMNVYGLMSRDYSKSEYAGVSDTQQITDYLGTLDNYAWLPESEQKNVKTATVTLGEPVAGYSVYYRYANNTNEELLIPSLTFPIQDVKGGEQYFYRDNVVIPLAADMLKEQMGNGMPIPLDGVRAM